MVAATSTTTISKVCFIHLVVVDEQGLLAFYEKHNAYPVPGKEEDAKEVVALAQEIATASVSEGESKFDEETEKWMTSLAKGAKGVISPMATVFGGIIGQEIIKASSSKYTPIKQFLYFDALECLPPGGLSEEECAPTNSRYDSQIAVFGKKFNEKILNLRYFLVGAGAIGCEMLKCWAMMGLGAGPFGKVDVTDMDTIEISNLNRFASLLAHLFPTCHLSASSWLTSKPIPVPSLGCDKIQI